MRINLSQNIMLLLHFLYYKIYDSILCNINRETKSHKIRCLLKIHKQNSKYSLDYKYLKIMIKYDKAEFVKEMEDMEIEHSSLVDKEENDNTIFKLIQPAISILFSKMLNVAS
jgi:hypothetical protein